MRGLFIGLTCIDILYPLSAFPEENSKNKCEEEWMDIGGPATNAAFAFAALGGEATLISLIGQHPFTDFMKAKLEEYGIHHIDLNPTLVRKPTISSVILNTNNGSRTILTAKSLKEEAILPPSILLDEYDVIEIDGFVGKYVREVLNEKPKEMPLVFDGGSFKPYTHELLSLVTHPVFSEHFAFPNQTSLLAELQKKKTNPFAITHGEHPIWVQEADLWYEIPVPHVKAIDTLGAGDLFHGALAWYLLEENGDFRKALTKASKIASLSCQYIGTRKWTGRI